jgi:hypothetical protein
MIKGAQPVQTGRTVQNPGRLGTRGFEARSTFSLALIDRRAGGPPCCLAATHREPIRNWGVADRRIASPGS